MPGSVKGRRVRVKPPTERQDEFLATVGALVPGGAEKPAGVAAIARAVGVQPAGARPQLEALRTKGLIREVVVMKPTKAYMLTPKGWARLKGEEE